MSISSQWFTMHSPYDRPAPANHFNFEGTADVSAIATALYAEGDGNDQGTMDSYNKMFKYTVATDSARGSSGARQSMLSSQTVANFNTATPTPFTHFHMPGMIPAINLHSMDHLAYFAPSCASRSSPLNPAIVCQWGTSCGISLPHCSFSTIKRHIKEYHFGGDAHGWHDQLRGHCMWSAGGNVCGKEVMYGHFGKHIATVHTRSVYRRCSRCHQEFSRGDSLQRHQKHYCPAGRP